MNIATSQFPVSSNIRRNASYIKRHIRKAAKKGAHIVHFPETALSGYARVHFSSFEGFNWQLLKECTQEICHLANILDIWIILGTTRLASKTKPQNSICIISNTGKIAGFYNKQRLYSKEKDYYSSGNHIFSINIRDVNCGFLICYDSCFPDLYTQYRGKGVQLLFHSFYNANNSGPANSLDNLILAQLRTRAADNQMVISASNSSERHSRLASCIVKPDGALLSSRRHRAGIIVESFNTTKLGWTYDNRQT